VEILTFDNPLALLLIPLIGILWLIARFSKLAIALRHKRIMTIMRAAILVLIALATAQPNFRLGGDDVSVSYMVDVSRSVSPDYVEKAFSWIAGAQGKFKPASSNIVVFGKNSAVVRDLDEAKTLSVLDSGADANTLSENFIEQSGTNIESALDESLASLGKNKANRIVLFTDGNETDGSVVNVLDIAKRSNTKIFPMAADSIEVSDAWIESVRLPKRIRAAEPVSILARLYSPRDSSLTLSLASEEKNILTQKFQVQTGLNEIVLTASFPTPGDVNLSVEITMDGDEFLENNAQKIGVWVEKKAKVLFVEGIEDTNKYLQAALESAGFEVELGSANRLPSLDDLKRFDTIILSDVLATSLPVSSMKDIRSFVRDHGGGLVFAGGENTFGEEGYSDSILEELLPAEFKAQEKKKELALVIAIDRSYSMKGRKIEYAKEAARASLDLLEEQHQFGVVAFDSQPYVPVPLQPVKSKRKAEALISRIQASGQTNIYPALGIVYRLLKDVEAPTKHVILLSDGDTAPAEFERLIERMREKNIVISTVTIGEGGNPGLMKQISDWGNGRNYMALSAESIPQIFTEETQKVVGTSLVEEQILTVVKQPTQALSGIAFADAPALKGHIAVKEKDTAEVVLATQDGSPLLTRWQYGLGKVFMFSSDVKNRWSADWMNWDGYGKFWAQLTRDSLKQLGSDTVFFDVSQNGASARFSLTLLDFDGRFLNNLSPNLRIRTGDAEDIREMPQVAPGRYEIELPLGNMAISGALVVSDQITEQMADMAGSRTVFPGYPLEYRFSGTNQELLGLIADTTGGKVSPVSDEVFRVDEKLDTKSPVWVYLIALAILLYLADIFIRRSPILWERYRK